MKYRVSAVILMILLLGGVAYLLLRGGDGASAPPPPLEPPPAAASTAEVHRLCSACHVYPPPDSFPRPAWRNEVRQAYEFLRASDLRGPYPGLESVTRYYEERAPEAFPPLDRGPAPQGLLPVHFQPSDLSPPGGAGLASVTNIRLASLFDPKRLDLLVCELGSGKIWALKLAASPPTWHLLGQVHAPAHVEVVDLDGDGHMDLLIADLGSFTPTNDRVGSVVWLHNDGKGGFNPVTLLDGVGRVADVRAADFRGDGKLDLIVAVFGWRTTGEVLHLVNRTTDWSRPTFTRTVLDSRPGAIHVPVGDIDGDGKPDIVALISQASETVVAFLNRGDGTFRKETIYEAPHPGFSSSGIQLADLNGDGKLDVIYTNGDTLDSPGLLKPYNGIHWLENPGTFPFRHHLLTSMYGVMRAEVLDVDGDGALDVVAVGFLPPEHFPDGQAAGAEGVVLLRQSGPGKFERHVLQIGDCDHLTCAAGDVFGDGKAHFVTGNFFLGPRPGGATVTLWKNLGGLGGQRQPKPPDK